MIRRSSRGDAGELLTLQRAAYVSEGQIYENASIPPLTQTLAELEAELAEIDRAEGDDRLAHRRHRPRQARGRDAAHRADRGRARHAGPRHRHGADRAPRGRARGRRAHVRALHRRLEPGEPAAVRTPRLSRDARRGARLRRAPRAPGEARGARSSLTLPGDRMRGVHGRYSRHALRRALGQPRGRSCTRGEGRPRTDGAEGLGVLERQAPLLRLPARLHPLRPDARDRLDHLVAARLAAAVRARRSS